MTKATTILGWTAIFIANGVTQSETFLTADVDGDMHDDRTSWVHARDALVDQFLDDSEHAAAEAISNLLCDADPDEALSFTLAGLEVRLVAKLSEPAYVVESTMMEIVLSESDGAPIATFHVTDEWADEDEGSIDEEEAKRLAAVCADALNARLDGPLFRSVRAEQVDGTSFQIIVGDEHGTESEYAVVTASNDNAEDGGLSEAQGRADALVSLLSRRLA